MQEQKKGIHAMAELSYDLLTYIRTTLTMKKYVKSLLRCHILVGTVEEVMTERLLPVFLTKLPKPFLWQEKAAT